MSELLPCPFCGSEAEFKSESSYGYYDYSFIQCANKKCQVRPMTIKFNNIEWSANKGNIAKYKKAKKDAIKAWNTRADIDPLALKTPYGSDKKEVF